MTRSLFWLAGLLVVAVLVLTGVFYLFFTSNSATNVIDPQPELSDSTPPIKQTNAMLLMELSWSELNNAQRNALCQNWEDNFQSVLLQQYGNLHTQYGITNLDLTVAAALFYEEKC